MRKSKFTEEQIIGFLKQAGAGMPLLAWLTLSTEGKQIPFFGLQLPLLIGENKSVAGWAKEVHEVGGTIGYFLIGLSACGGRSLPPLRRPG